MLLKFIMKKNISLLELKKEILNIPIGSNVKDKDIAHAARLDIGGTISSYYYNSTQTEVIIGTVKNNDLNLLQLFLQSPKIDIHATDQQGYNILHLAVKFNSLDIIDYLLKNTDIGPTCITIPDRYNLLFHIAAKYGNSETIKYLCEKKEDLKINPSAKAFDLNILHIAAINSNIEAMDFILKNAKNLGIDPLEKEDGYNILHFSAKYGSVESIKFLLSKTKDLNLKPSATTSQDMDILDIAINNGRIEMVEYLFENRESLGIDVTVESYFSECNKLHFAASSGSIEIMDYLIKKTKELNIKLDPTAKDVKGFNILHYAIINSKVKMVEYLIKNANYIGIDPIKSINDVINKKIDDKINIIDLFVKQNFKSHTKSFSREDLETLKCILKEGAYHISYDWCEQLIQLTQGKNPDFSNTISLIQHLLSSQQEKNSVDFSNQELDEELLLKMLEKYFLTPQCIQKTIGEIKDIYVEKLKDAKLPEKIIKAVPNLLNELADKILIQESYLMSQDYTLYTEDCPLENIYYELPLLIKSFNPKHEIEIYGLNKWFTNTPDLKEQLDNFITSVKELQDFIKTSDKKDEIEDKIKQIAELKMNFTELVYNNFAGVYLDKLSKLSEDEIMEKCKANEYFAEQLKSIKPLLFNTEKVLYKFDSIIKIYESEKSYSDINFQNLVIIEGSESNNETINPEDKKPMGDYEPGSCFFE